MEDVSEGRARRLRAREGPLTSGLPQRTLLATVFGSSRE